ncbi:MAG TPA: hypothetical protein VEF34_01625 [Syntrophobacteraceae bacterium]|nr:hypothetical protein [Syntrophobacteraceae bacterium]
MQMALDLDKMNEIVHHLYVLEIAKAYGDIGTVLLRKILITLRKLYEYIEPEKIRGKLIVLISINDEAICDPSSSKTFTSIDYLAQEFLYESGQITWIIQIFEDGKFKLWRELSIDTSRISESAVVYSYQARNEYFVIKGYERLICNPSPVHSSVFAMPTFGHLSDALEDYKRRSIRYSSCEIFRQTWHGGQNSNRLFFKTKPEKTMRRSLAQFLNNVIRDAEVRPEQNVDESHPVDIKVTWMFTNRLALIEIKWLGKSLAETGDITVDYTESRANGGAKQLADYLDRNRSRSPAHQTVGYLVVIDGRRRGLTESSHAITYENGMWYKDREISYDPEYHVVRDDFAKPIRMFAEPICTPN